MFSRFFIERPRFAIVVCVIMVLTGIISLTKLPVRNILKSLLHRYLFQPPTQAQARTW